MKNLRARCVIELLGTEKYDVSRVETERRLSNYHRGISRDTDPWKSEDPDHWIFEGGPGPFDLGAWIEDVRAFLRVHRRHCGVNIYLTLPDSPIKPVDLRVFIDVVIVDMINAPQGHSLTRLQGTVTHGQIIDVIRKAEAAMEVENEPA